MLLIQLNLYRYFILFHLHFLTAGDSLMSDRRKPREQSSETSQPQ